VRRVDRVVIDISPEGHEGERGYGKIRWRYILGVASIFPHTYIHFPSTSSVRYIAPEIRESMSVTRNLHFHGKYVKRGSTRECKKAARHRIEALGAVYGA